MAKKSAKEEVKEIKVPINDEDISKEDLSSLGFDVSGLEHLAASPHILIGYKVSNHDTVIEALDLENAEIGKCVVILGANEMYVGMLLDDVTYRETIDSHFSYVEVFMGRRIESILGKRQDPAIHMFYA